MAKARHTLAQILSVVALCSAACETVAPGVDGGEHSKDAAAETFKLCDGSDEIRLGYQSGGGFVDEGYQFEQPYGFQFLFVDGQCNFILATHAAERPGKFVSGHLSDDTAAEIEQRLGLASLPTGTFYDKEACPDAGTVALATTRFYGDCTCGCDKGAPAGLERALSAMDATLELVRALGAAASGDVEVAAQRQGSVKADAARAWPLAWPLADIDNATLSDSRAKIKMRVLQGKDAQTARDFFAEARKDQIDATVYAASEGSSYRVFLRERVDLQLAQRIARFQLESDPSTLRPIAACNADAQVNTTFSSVFVDRQYLYGSVDSLPVCGMRVCWDGELQEKQPVAAPLRIVKASKPRPCLSGPPTSFQLDLTPILDAYRAGYPNARVEIELSLPGWSGETLKLTQ